MDKLREDGVYYVAQVSEHEGVSYATVELEGELFMYAFSSAERARPLAEAVGGRVHWHPVLTEVFEAFPEELAGLVVDVDLETGEGWLLRTDEVS
ncbi:MAG TPA: hypothetical protein ENJ85_00775 [Oceanithermus profundus]|uniref:Uncharacterized protein n=1 Tax=Oceanithermus profundus TaxID=187137 RepID=A0A7C5SPM4_9DEIN|nr:hypothetical protein [Oceanithermus profundus]